MPQRMGVKLPACKLSRLSSKRVTDFVQRINGSLRAWLEQLPAHAVLTDRKPIKPKPRENETLLAAVNRTRDGIAELTKEQFEVNQAGLPIDAMKAMAKRWVEEKARYRPRIRAGHDGGFSVSFDPAANFETSSKVDVGAVLSALDAPAMIRLLQKEIDAMPKPKLAMTPAEKAQRLAEIKTELFDLECKEEALIEKAEQQGQLIPRRPNSNIAAVLAITVSSRRRVAA